MKKLIYLLLFVLPSILAGQTILYNASTPHTDGTPSGAPTTYGAWIRYDKTNKVLYRWTGAAWTAITGAGTGGIYGGSGTVPAGTTASMDAGIAFANASASAGERFSVTLDDGSSTNYFELEAGQGILLQSSGDGIFFEGETGFTDVISSGALGANQNDYAGLDGANVGRLSASTAIDITGIAGGFDGRILYLYNIGANTITLKNNNGSSAEASQFDIGADYELTGDNGVVIQYDGVSTNWRIAGNKLAGAGGIYSGDGSIYAGGADVTFDGTNPLRFRRAGSSAEPIVQKLFSSGTTGYFDRFRINNDSMDFFYALGRFVWQSKGTGMNFACDTGNIQIETQVGFGSFSADSVRINEMPIRPEVYYMVGSDNDGYLKRIVGSASGDLLVWDTAGADHWEVRDGANYVHNYTSGTIRPAQLTATTNNWNPTGYSTTRRQTIEVSGDASFRCVTGLTAATRDGVEKTLINTGTNCLVLAKQHTSSDAANRFNISKDVIMLPGMEATFRYDSVGAAWRLKATSKDDVTFNALTETSLKNGFSTTGGDYPDFAWTANGGAFSGSGATGTTFRNRFFQFSTSTAAMAWPTLSTKVREIYIDSDFSYHRMTGRVRIEDLATGANAFEVRFGYKTTLDTNIVEGAYINYNYTENSGGWTLKTHDGSTLTTTNAGAAVAADTWYNLELIYYPYGEVTCFINGSRFTTTSTLPEGLTAMPFLQLDKDEGSTGTTARLMYVTAFDTFGCNVSE